MPIDLLPPDEHQKTRQAMRSQRKFALWFGLFILVLIANAAFAYRATYTLIDNYKHVARSHEISKELEMLFSLVKDAETGQRGYMITADEKYLEPYNSAIVEIDNQLKQLKELLAEDQTQITRLPQLESNIKDALAEIRETIEVNRTQGPEAARAIVKTNRGKVEMDNIRRIVAQMENDENVNLSRLEAESQASGRRTLFTFSLASFLALALISMVYLLLNRDLNQRQRAEEDLREANEKLETRVIARTTELMATNARLKDEITERQRAEDKLQDFADELERSNRELQDFAFVASHDLQEPLRKIQAFGDRLKTRYAAALSVEGSDYVDRMQNAARRMHILINDLLMYSRVTTQAHPFVPVNLNEILREVLNDLEVRLMETGGCVDLNALPAVEADALQMRQLLQNLIGNAFKFHRPDVPPVVKISSRIFNKSDDDAAIGDTCEIMIQDNGIGFDEKYLDRIFTPFQRLHARGEYEGTGMGLAVCRKIVERHGGDITARSATGQGTTFIVTLPIKQQTGASKG